MADRRHRIQKAAELSGVPEELIRMWERRYAVVEPERTESGYRMYSDTDVEVLRRLRVLTEQGTPIGEAARLVPELRKEVQREGKSRQALTHAPPLERWKREVVQGALGLDQPQVERALDEALSALPAIQVVDEVILPMLVEIGDLWHAGKLSVAQEHLATQALRGRVLALLHLFTIQEGRRHVVVACVPDEQHEMGALSVALRLRYAGARVTYLGQRTPAAELGGVMQTGGVDALALSAVTDPGADAFAAMLDEVRAALPDGRPVVMGGRAASRYADEVRKHGFRVFDDGGWSAALDLLMRR